MIQIFGSLWVVGSVQYRRFTDSRKWLEVDILHSTWDGGIENSFFIRMYVFRPAIGSLVNRDHIWKHGLEDLEGTISSCDSHFLSPPSYNSFHVGFIFRIFETWNDLGT
jgi:hypothetical protein